MTFDTNVLENALTGHRRSFFDFCERCASNDIQVILSEVIVYEVIYRLEKDLKNRRSRLVSDIKDLHGIYKIDVSELSIPRIDIRAFVDDIVSEAQINIVPMPESILLKPIIELAIRHTLPFESGDKGFRDYFFYDSIKNYALNLGLDRVLLVSNDKVFWGNSFEAAAKKDISEFSCVRDIESAFEFIKAWLEEVETEELVARSEGMRDFLEMHLDKLEVLIINNGLLTDHIISGAIFGTSILREGQTPVHGAIKSVSNVKILGVELVVPLGVINRASTLVEEALVSVNISCDVTSDDYGISFASAFIGRKMLPDSSGKHLFTERTPAVTTQTETVERTVTIRLRLIREQGNFIDFFEEDEFDKRLRELDARNAESE